MGADCVVFLPPAFNYMSCLGQGCKPIQVQAFVSQPSIKAFNKAIFNWLARGDKTQLYTLFITPLIQNFTYEFRAIVTHYCFG